MRGSWSSGHDSDVRTHAGAAVIGLVGLAVLLAGCQAAPAEKPELAAETAGLVESLRAGGHVIFLRHAATDSTIPSGGDDHRDDCGGQRNLTRAGRRDAALLGDTLEALGVPVGEVRASPYCRTLDTARLAFGDVRPDDRLLPLEGATERLQPLLDPPADGNRVLVGHSSTVDDLLGIYLEEGEAAVLDRGADGEPRLVGRLSAQMLQPTSGGG